MNIIKKLFGLLYKGYIMLRERFFQIPPLRTQPPPETQLPQPSSIMGEGVGEADIQQEYQLVEKQQFQPSQVYTSGGGEVGEEGGGGRSGGGAELLQRTGDFEAPPLLAGQRISLCETLDRVLNTGVVVHGDITISVANIDLIYIGLRALLTSVETARQSGINHMTDF